MFGTMQRSSGTTGRPKDYVISAEMLAARVADIARIRPPGWTALASIYNDFAHNGRTGAMRDTQWAAATGKKFFAPVRSANSADDFLLTAKQFTDNNIEGIFAPPAGLAKYAEYFLAQKIVYRPKIMVVTSGLLTPDLSRAIRAGLGDALWVCYGTGETSGLTLGTAAEAEAIAGCVGKACPQVEIRIVDGEVQVKSPLTIKEYADPAHTAAKFTSDGWFRTSDKGYLTPDGLLVYQGRLA